MSEEKEYQSHLRSSSFMSVMFSKKHNVDKEPTRTVDVPAMTRRREIEDRNIDKEYNPGNYYENVLE